MKKFSSFTTFRSFTTFARPPKFDHSVKKYTGPTRDEIEEMRAKFHAKVALFYESPLTIVEGSMQYLFDEKGNRYVDMFAGIATVSCGHCHPKVVEAGIQQMKRLQHCSNLFLNPQMALYSKELVAKLPPQFECVFLVNSGTDANELATLLARQYTNNFDMISMSNGYHGSSSVTSTLGGMSTWKFKSQKNVGVFHAKHPYLAKFPALINEDKILEFFVNDVEEIIKCSTNGKVAGFISETVQGVGGVVPLIDGYLKEVYEIIRKNGGVCISDEVQTGFGRLGNHFWGFESQGVVPDIVTMAKGMGNGFPLGAVATTREIMDKITERNFFNTFGGNPVGAAIGRAVLEVIEEDQLQANAANVGGQMKAQLRRLQEKYPLIGDVRGEGLLLGVEIVDEEGAPNKIDAALLQDMMKSHKVIIGRGGYAGNVLRLKPPLCATRADADYTVLSLSNCFELLPSVKERSVNF
eukprot:GHVL01002959.1.p1 GENE.GHVL01002959.1~~GHVL01002959.1.p1  ORF type:complete len:467 (+),score=94.84 GHVL01002959.1:10-1410(+)